MQKKFSYTYLTDLCISLLLVVSMLCLTDRKIADFPVYTLVFFLIVLAWLAGRIIYGGGAGQSFLSIHYFADTLSVAAILYAVCSIIGRLFRDPDKGAIDFSWNAEVIALALICLLISAGIEFRSWYFDLILYSGLFLSGIFMLTFFSDVEIWKGMSAVFADSGIMASYFMLISMIGVYGYCVNRDKLRSAFYLCVSGIAFFALFLNKNVISLWLMVIYFLAVPVVLCPTVVLVERVMQMFFLYGFMLSNMGILTEYTQILNKELSYSTQLSVYIDLLIAVGGIAFFRYWDRIPENVDKERLVLRKMQKRYRFLLKFMFVLFVVTLAEEAGNGKSGLICGFQNTGMISGVCIIFFMLVLSERMQANYREEKTLTGILILISVIFMIQLLFWDPGIHNTAVYVLLLAAASFYQEEYLKIDGVGINAVDLQMEIQEIK